MAGGQSYDVNVNFNIDAGQPTQDGRALRKGRIRNKNGEAIQQYNFKSIAKLGLALRWARMGNEFVGAYTGQRLRQQKVQAALTGASYVIGVAVAGPFGIAYTAADIGYRQLMLQTRIMNQNAKAEITAEKTGNATRRQSRGMGGKL